MSGIRPRHLRRKATPNLRAKMLLTALMADRGWHAIDIERASTRPGSGHPGRIASESVVYRVLDTGHTPLAAAQFEIAAVFKTDDGRHLLPSHIWGSVPLPEPYAYLNAGLVAAA